MLDRAGLTGPDGPTHHGLFDVGYMRLFPNMVCMAPGYAAEVEPMLSAALAHDQPCSIRYPKASALQLEHQAAPVEIGKSETIREGSDGTIIAFGAVLEQALAAAEILKDEQSYVAIYQDFSLDVLDYINAQELDERKALDKFFDSPGVFDGFVNVLV